MSNNTIETLKLATELIRLGVAAIDAVRDFIAWFRADPSEAARVAREKRQETAAGWSRYNAAKSARSDGK